MLNEARVPRATDRLTFILCSYNNVINVIRWRRFAEFFSCLRCKFTRIYIFLVNFPFEIYISVLPFLNDDSNGGMCVRRGEKKNTYDDDHCLGLKSFSISKSLKIKQIKRYHTSHYMNCTSGLLGQVIMTYIE